MYSLSGLSWEVSAFLGQFLNLFYEWFSLLRDSNCGLYECFETIQHVMDARIDLFVVHLDEGCRLGNLEIYVAEITIKRCADGREEYPNGILEGSVFDSVGVTGLTKGRLGLVD